MFVFCLCTVSTSYKFFFFNLPFRHNPSSVINILFIHTLFALSYFCKFRLFYLSNLKAINCTYFFVTDVEDCNGCGWVWLVSIFKILIRLLGTILNCFFPHLDHEFMGGVSNVLKIDTELSSQHLSDVPVRLRRKTFSQAAVSLLLLATFTQQLTTFE